MAVPEARRLPQNAPGPWYTTDECDGCAYCASVAPDNFDYEKQSNRYFVRRQPGTPREEEVVREAKEDCPLDAIVVDEELVHVPVQEKRHENNG